MPFTEEEKKVIDLAKSTDFDEANVRDGGSLETFETTFYDLRLVTVGASSTAYDTFVHNLAEYKDQNYYESTGWKLLSWLLEHEPDLFTNKISSGNPEYHEFRLPIHSAISFRNVDFLDCLLDVSDTSEESIAEILESRNMKRQTCVHAAVEMELPCAVDMVRKCSTDTLTATDNAGDSLLHVAMRLARKDAPPKLNLNRQRQGQARSDKPPRPNTSVPRAHHSDPSVELRRVPTLVNIRTNKARSFDPHELYKEIKERLAASVSVSETTSTSDGRPKNAETGNNKPKTAMELLKLPNNSGKSPFQIRLLHYLRSRELFGPGLHTEMKTDIFEQLSDISDVKKALYGTEGPEKELFLDMSDFNNPSHDFKSFIADLTVDLETATTATPPAEDENTEAKQGEDIQFEQILFYVCLPDFRNLKDSPHNEVRRLFLWLRDRKVKTIRSLSIPDSTTNPMSDALVGEAIIDNFDIKELDWRKLDINLRILTDRTPPAQFTKLTLYSSGNWSVLYHWASEEGLAKLKSLKELTINIVGLPPSSDDEARARHKSLTKQYAGELHKKLNDLFYRGFVPTVVLDADWNFPISVYDQKSNPLVANSLMLHGRLAQCHEILEGLARSENKVFKTNPERRAYQKLHRWFSTLTQPPQSEKPDQRIKVAVIDNGVDRMRESVKNKVEKGISFVTAGPENDERILPWWMVSDPHGTQMASLIAQENPFCRLYVARVGRNRRDILPENAAKARIAPSGKSLWTWSALTTIIQAVRWAIEQKVDIISISWITKKKSPELERAIADAVTGGTIGRPILVFCSTADEGIYAGKVYPADYDGTVSVAATDRYGHLQPTAPGRVNVLVPGDNVEAEGPSYMQNFATGTVSGSSVATASAAGIASLVLLLLKTFNEDECETRRGHTPKSKLEDYYKSSGIMEVFERMQRESKHTAIQLSDFFPEDKVDIAKLRETWELGRFRSLLKPIKLEGS